MLATVVKLEDTLKIWRPCVAIWGHKPKQDSVIFEYVINEHGL